MPAGWGRCTARATCHGTSVAVKMLQQRLLAERGGEDSFHREARAAVRANQNAGVLGFRRNADGYV